MKHISKLPELFEAAERREVVRPADLFKLDKRTLRNIMVYVGTDYNTDPILKLVSEYPNLRKQLAEIFNKNLGLEFKAHAGHPVISREIIDDPDYCALVELQRHVGNRCQWHISITPKLNTVSYIRVKRIVTNVLNVLPGPHEITSKPAVVVNCAELVEFKHAPMGWFTVGATQDEIIESIVAQHVGSELFNKIPCVVFCGSEDKIKYQTEAIAAHGITETLTPFSVDKIFSAIYPSHSFVEYGSVHDMLQQVSEKDIRYSINFIAIAPMGERSDCAAALYKGLRVRFAATPEAKDLKLRYFDFGTTDPLDLIRSWSGDIRYAVTDKGTRLVTL